MKKLVVVTFLMAIFSVNVWAGTTPAKKEVIGEWKYEVPAAPYGYESGTIVINEKEGKLIGEVKLKDGYKIDLKNVSCTDGVLKCGLYVDYEYVSIKAKVEGKTLSGIVDTPEGEMKLTAKKQ